MHPDDLNVLQPGDALNHAADHIILVTAVYEDGTIEIIHETIPQLKKEILSGEEIVSRFSEFSIYRYNGRANVKSLPVLFQE